MSSAEFYLTTLGVFGCTGAIQAIGFNLQFGTAGIINLAYILLVAVGAYATAIASVGAATGNQTYVGGFHLPFPLNLAFGVAVTIGVGMLLGVTALLRLRHDYLALTLIAMAQGAQIFVGSDLGLVNGSTGMSGVVGPFENQLSLTAYPLVFLGICAVSLVVVYAIVARMTSAPFGRALRAVRDDEVAVAAVGRNTWQLRFSAFVVGAGLAGLAGGLLVLYTGGWNPQSWLPTESVVLLAAVIVGGRGRNEGAMVGAAIVLVVIAQGSTFLPQFGPPALLPSLQTMLIGVIVLAFLWWRPDGLLPERRERFTRTRAYLRRRGLGLEIDEKAVGATDVGTGG